MRAVLAAVLAVLLLPAAAHAERYGTPRAAARSPSSASANRPRRPRCS